MDNEICVGAVNNEELYVKFNYDKEKVRKVKLINGRRWEPKEKYWTIPYTEENINKIIEVFGINDVNFHKSVDVSSIIAKLKLTFYEIGIAVDKHLKLKGYSRKTIKSYKNNVIRFLSKVNKFPDDITNDDVKNYLVFLLEKQNSSHSYVNQVLSAIKLYFKEILLRNDIVYNLPRPKRENKLPEILSKEEVARIFKGVRNIKHKAILYLIYSAGLRVGEVVRLKVHDIDENRMLIRVVQGKGRKDRYTLLSKAALDIVNKYRKVEEGNETGVKAGIKGSENWLFPGRKKNRFLTERAVQKVFNAACNKAKIQKDVTVHTLRHYVESNVMGSSP